MTHEAKSYDHLLGKLRGIGDAQLKAHFGLYQGYVKKLNEISGKLAQADAAGGNYSFNEFAELKRREAVPLNGAVLHEMYFDNLGGQAAVDGTFKSKVVESFGSWDRWVAEVRGTATSTHGWVLTCYDPSNHRLNNYLVGEHHIGLPAGQQIVLALDCWEHAYMIDFGTAKAKYLDAFMDNIDWSVVGRRLGAVAR